MDLPKDKNGREIHPLNTIRWTFYNKQPVYPGRHRIIIDGMSGEKSVLSDDGGFLAPTVQWVDFKVRLSGACLVIKRVKVSDFQVVMTGENVSMRTGRWIPVTTEKLHFDEHLDGSEFEVQK